MVGAQITTTFDRSSSCAVEKLWAILYPTSDQERSTGFEFERFLKQLWVDIVKAQHLFRDLEH